MTDPQLTTGKIWTITQLLMEQTQPYYEFLRIPAMSMGLYKLPAGGVDGQSPHNEDETYYVVSGRAQMEIAGERQPVQAGSVIFVAAHVDHRFVEIEEELVIVVFFAPAET